MNVLNSNSRIASNKLTSPGQKQPFPNVSFDQSPSKPIKAYHHGNQIFSSDESQMINSNIQIENPYPTTTSITAGQMKVINDKLRNDFTSLIERVETVFTKFKQRKEQHPKSIGINEAINEDEMQNDKELKKSEIKALTLKKEIERLRRKLELSCDILTITDLENGIKNKELILAKLEDQNQQIRKVGFHQKKAMDEMNKEEEIQARLKHVNVQIRQLKVETKEIQEKYKDADKQVKEQHKQIYDLEEKQKKIQDIIKQKKQKQKQVNLSMDDVRSKDLDPDDQLTEQELELAVKALEEYRLDEDRKLKKNLVNIEKQLSQQKDDYDLAMLRYREKEQEIKMVELKMREVKRAQQIQKKTYRGGNGMMI